MDVFPAENSLQAGENGSIASNQSTNGGGGNSKKGPLTNLLQNKKPPVSMHLMSNNNNHVAGTIPAVASSNIGFNSG